MIIFFDIETVNNEYLDEKNYKVLQEKHGDGLPFMPEYNHILTITVGVKTAEGTKIENLPGSEEDQIKKFFEIVEKDYKVKRDGKEVSIFTYTLRT